jgi:uncharacterized cupredoxin-like copper-binding protein
LQGPETSGTLPGPDGLTYPTNEENNVLRKLMTIVAIAVAGLLLAACNGDGDGGEATTTIDVTGTDALAFEPDSFTVPAGEEVTVNLTAEGGVEHDFVIEEIDEEVVHADPGETATGTFTIDDPGPYTVYCEVPGHREAGMEADLEVIEQDG